MFPERATFYVLLFIQPFFGIEHTHKKAKYTKHFLATKLDDSVCMGQKYFANSANENHSVHRRVLHNFWFHLSIRVKLMQSIGISFFNIDFTLFAPKSAYFFFLLNFCQLSFNKNITRSHQKCAFHSFKF